MNPMMWSSTSWDGTGLCVYAKRLEQGKFACLWSGVDGEPVRLTTSELSLFLEGSRFVGKISLSPPEMTQFSLATGSRS
jgi:transposase